MSLHFEIIWCYLMHKVVVGLYFKHLDGVFVLVYLWACKRIIFILSLVIIVKVLTCFRVKVKKKKFSQLWDGVRGCSHIYMMSATEGGVADFWFFLTRWAGRLSDFWSFLTAGGGGSGIFWPFWPRLKKHTKFSKYKQCSLSLG